MMGEEDSNPLGFHRHPPGLRMPSMMAPSVLRDGTVELVLGSAGSNRIRSALLQTIVGVVDAGAARERVAAPRVHFEGGALFAEPGIDLGELEGRAARSCASRRPKPNLRRRAGEAGAPRRSAERRRRPPAWGRGGGGVIRLPPRCSPRHCSPSRWGDVAASSAADLFIVTRTSTTPLDEAHAAGSTKKAGVQCNGGLGAENPCDPELAGRRGRSRKKAANPACISTSTCHRGRARCSATCCARESGTVRFSDNSALHCPPSSTSRSSSSSRSGSRSAICPSRGLAGTSSSGHRPSPSAPSSAGPQRTSPRVILRPDAAARSGSGYGHRCCASPPPEPCGPTTSTIVGDVADLAVVAEAAFQRLHLCWRRPCRSWLRQSPSDPPFSRDVGYDATSIARTERLRGPRGGEELGCSWSPWRGEQRRSEGPAREQPDGQACLRKRRPPCLRPGSMARRGDSSCRVVSLHPTPANSRARPELRPRWPIAAAEKEAPAGRLMRKT